MTDEINRLEQLSPSLGPARMKQKRWKWRPDELLPKGAHAMSGAVTDRNRAGPEAG